MEKFEKMEAKTIGRETLEKFNKRKRFMDRFIMKEKEKPEENKNFGLQPKPSKEALTLQEKSFNNIRLGK